jgi:hypothetical protein
MKTQRHNSEKKMPTQMPVREIDKLHPAIAFLFEAYRNQRLAAQQRTWALGSR